MIAVLCLLACSSQKKEANVPEKKVLVIYYSQVGSTKIVAEEISKQLNADIEAIEVKNPYDGDFQQTIEQCQKEMAAGELPEVAPLKANIADYDIIFIGYPIWFGTYASPITSLVKTEAFEDKEIVTFCTFGSGGLQASTKNLQEALPKAKVTEGYCIRAARIGEVESEVNRFLIEKGYKAGEVEALPAFMEHKPVTDEDVKVFNEACGDYQFPLGTPIDVAIRETQNSTDYEYSVKSNGQNGEETTSTIYVTIKKGENAKAEFTQVVR